MKNNIIIFIIILIVSISYGEPLKNDYQVKKKPLLRSAIGNIAGLALGAIAGGFISSSIISTDTKSNPDASLRALSIWAMGAYTGGIIGSATGSTIALGSGLSFKEKGILFSTSLAPHIVHYGILLTDKNSLSHSKPFKISFCISIPLSITLPSFYYKKVINQD